MTKTRWEHDKISVKEIAKHLQDTHCDGFNSRVSLTEDEFIEEHFPDLVKDLATLNQHENYLSPEGKKRVATVRNLLRSSLKFCEEHSIPIARVVDMNEKGEFEWRICKPTQEELDILKHSRYFSAAEGYFNKVVLQQNMLDPADIDALLSQLREQIEKTQDEREGSRTSMLQREQNAEIKATLQERADAEKELKEAAKAEKKENEKENDRRGK